MDCPGCSGRGSHAAFVSRTGGVCGYEDMPCRDCGGVGQVTHERREALLDAALKGDALRADRIARRLSLREEAARLGISVVALSDRERGR